MKKKLLVFSLTICILISFIACGETNEPIITEAPESSSSSNTAGEETSSATETTGNPPIEYNFSNVAFNNVREMVDKLKNGEVDIKNVPYANDKWLEIDFDRFYELSNLPEGFDNWLVEWAGQNSYMAYYGTKDLTVENLEITFEMCKDIATLEKNLKFYLPWYDEEAGYSKFDNVRISYEETEYGMLKTWVFDTNTSKDIVCKRMDVFDNDGKLLWVYVYKYSIKNSVDPLYRPSQLIFNYDEEMPYIYHNRGSFPLETLLSLTPVKVEVDG